MQLRYGCNPHQAYAAVEGINGANPPITVLNGAPSMINYLDALNAWQLVFEARAALGLPAAASFKHVSPAGAAVAVDLPPDLAQVYEVSGRDLTPAATAYVRARGADPKSSFGDFVALSDPVDNATANFLKGVVSDGIVAPDYEPEAFKTLAAKKNGSFIVMQADVKFHPRRAKPVKSLACSSCKTATIAPSSRPISTTSCAVISPTLPAAIYYSVSSRSNTPNPIRWATPSTAK